jgi:hypothetical protein
MRLACLSCPFCWSGLAELLVLCMRMILLTAGMWPFNLWQGLLPFQLGQPWFLLTLCWKLQFISLRINTVWTKYDPMHPVHALYHGVELSIWDVDLLCFSNCCFVFSETLSAWAQDHPYGLTEDTTNRIYWSHSCQQCTDVVV